MNDLHQGLGGPSRKEFLSVYWSSRFRESLYSSWQWFPFSFLPLFSNLFVKEGPESKTEFISPYRANGMCHQIPLGF
jgi:hypothetical protein